MILVAVDRGFGSKDAEFVPQAARILEAHGVAWPNTIAENGFETTKRRFNLDGYTKVLVDPHGIVRAVGMHGTELAEKVEAVMREWAKERRGKHDGDE